MRIYVHKLILLSSICLLSACQPFDYLKSIYSDEGKSAVSIDFTDTILTDISDVFSSVDIATTDGLIPLQQVFAVDGDTITASISRAALEEVNFDLSKIATKDNTSMLGNYISVTIRYLLIDTPESKHPTKGIQPFGKEASLRNSELLYDGNISFTFDAGDKVDDYGRLLGYVFVNGKLIQEILVREGYARVAYITPPNTKYLSRLQKAQTAARQSGENIWSIPNYVTDRGFNN